MHGQALADKWNKIYGNSEASTAVADVLQQNRFLLPKSGRALDLACGLGANALFLADHGLETHAWDISTVALNKLTGQAGQKQLKINCKQLDIQSENLPEQHFDVIVLAHFLDRSLCNAIMSALKADGLLFYQTYSKDKIAPCGPKTPDFLLARNELLELFKPLNVLVYKEHGRVGDLQFGERNMALFVGQKH